MAGKACKLRKVLKTREEVGLLVRLSPIHASWKVTIAQSVVQLAFRGE